MTNEKTYTYDDVLSWERAKGLLSKVYPGSRFTDGQKYGVDLVNEAYTPDGSHGPQFAEVERMKKHIVNICRRQEQMSVVASKVENYFKPFREKAVMVYDIMEEDGKTPANKFLVINGDDIADNCKPIVKSYKAVDVAKKSVDLRMMPYKFVKEY